MSCIGRGHDLYRDQIDGQWYWLCRDCPSRQVAAAPDRHCDLHDIARCTICIPLIEDYHGQATGSTP